VYFNGPPKFLPVFDNSDFSRSQSNRSIQIILQRIVSSDISYELDLVSRIASESGVDVEFNATYDVLEEKSGVHDLALTCLQLVMNSRILNSVTHVIDVAHYEPLERDLHLMGTSETALGRAIQLAGIYQLLDSAPSLWRLIEDTGDRDIAKTLVVLGGEYAIDSIVTKLTVSDRFGYENVNDGIYYFLIELGEEAGPILRKHILRDYSDDGLDSNVIDVMKTIGGTAIDELVDEFLISELYGDAGHELISYLLNMNHSGAYDVLFRVIENMRMQDRYDPKETEAWLKSPNFVVDPSKVIEALDGQYVKGALTYLSFCPIPVAREKIIELLQNDDTVLPATEALVNYVELETIPPLLNSTVNLLDKNWLFYEVRQPICLSVEFVHNLGLEGIRIVKTWLNRERWEERFAALVHLLYVATQEDGHNLLKTLSLNGLTSHFLESLHFNEGLDYEFINEVFLYAYVLAEAIPTEIYRDQLNPHEIANSIRNTEDVFSLIEYIKFDANLLQEDVVKSAVLERTDYIADVMMKSLSPGPAIYIKDVQYLMEDTRIQSAIVEGIRKHPFYYVDTCEGILNHLDEDHFQIARKLIQDEIIPHLRDASFGKLRRHKNYRFLFSDNEVHQAIVSGLNDTSISEYTRHRFAKEINEIPELMQYETIDQIIRDTLSNE
jgi:hypothetical protein